MSIMIKSLKGAIANRLRDISYLIDYGILRPSIVSISMTNRCNSKCPTCKYWKNTSSDQELSTSEWNEIISGIKDWYGPFQFSIGGGEPLIRDDIYDVIRHAVRNGCLPSIITNGLLLSKGTIPKLIDSGLKEIVISLNGIKEQTHDFTRGVPGGYKKIMKAIEELKKYDSRISIGIATVLMGYNLPEAADLVLWVKENNLSRISFQALFYETGNEMYEKGWHKDSVLWFTKNGTHSEYIDRLIGFKKAGYPIANHEMQLHHFKSYFANPDKRIPPSCKIGVHGFFVEPNGDLKLCYLFDPIGNLINDKPGALWNSKKARQIRKMIRRCQLNCRLKNCNYVA